MIDLQAITRAANELEPLPASVTRLAGLVSGDDWDMREVERTVSLDQALSFRLLRLANSAASGSLVEVVTIREAIVRMGVGSLLSLATAASVQKRLQDSLPQFGYGEGEMWRHSVASALAAEAAAGACRVPLPPEAHAASLLHDIGKLVLARFLDPEVLQVLGHAREEGRMSSLAAEIEILGVHHAELGGIVAQHWNLPGRIVTGITHHHTPDHAGDLIADLTHIANVAAKRVGTGVATGDDDLALNPGSLERLKLTPERFEDLVALVAKRLETVLARYAS